MPTSAGPWPGTWAASSTYWRPGAWIWPISSTRAWNSRSIRTAMPTWLTGGRSPLAPFSATAEASPSGLVPAHPYRTLPETASCESVASAPGLSPAARCCPNSLPCLPCPWPPFAQALPSRPPFCGSNTDLNAVRRRRKRCWRPAISMPW